MQLIRALKNRAVAEHIIGAEKRITAVSVGRFFAALWCLSLRVIAAGYSLHLSPIAFYDFLSLFYRFFLQPPSTATVYRYRS